MWKWRPHFHRASRWVNHTATKWRSQRLKPFLAVSAFHCLLLTGQHRVLYAPATAVAVKPEAGGRSLSSLSPPGGKGEFWQGFRSWALGTTRKPATLFLQASSGVLGPRLSGERRYSGGRRGEATPRCSSHREALRALLRRACVSQPQHCWHGHCLLRGQPVPWEMLSSVSLASLSRCQ